jgi:large subunit ribosomal protein L15e
MALNKYLNELWSKPKENLGEILRQRLIQWRKEPAFVRVEHPLRLDRAHALGYRAKKGFVVVRLKLKRGGRKREKITSGRKSSNTRMLKIVEKSYKLVAEERCQRQYPNLEVLNSYFAGKDGTHYWFEVIMVDPNNPEIKADKRISWIAGKQHQYRVLRGLTSAGKKMRGLRYKGKGAEKVRPSISANRAKRARKHLHRQSLPTVPKLKK